MARYASVTYEQEELGDNHDLGCKCCRMRTGADLPIPSDLDIDKIAEEGHKFRVSIFRDWTRLNAILKRFESTIQKRWMKKSVKQKREILLKARPEISTTHRPDYVNFRNISKQVSRSRSCRTEAFLWPYLNLEDLQQRHLLLLFLKSRGRNLPSTFRMVDINLANLGSGWDDHVDLCALGGFCCDYHHFGEDSKVSSSCMLFQNKHSPTKYGQLLEDEDIELLRLSQFPYLRDAKAGLLCMEIQAGVYSFLLACAKLILHDIKPSVMFFTAAHQPEPTADHFARPEYQSLTGLALEAPYGVPQALDIGRLMNLVEGRRSSAEDHIWMMQEDPAYFVDTFQEWNEHNDHRPHKICNCKDCRTKVTARVIENAFRSFVYWDDIYRKLRAMSTLNVQMSRADKFRVTLADGDCERWAALMNVVWQMLVVPMELLKEGLPNSPRLRNRYRWSKDVGRDGDWTLRFKSTDAEVRVHTLFEAIGNSQHTWYKTLPGLVNEVQYMIDTDHEASQYIDEWITNQYSDLALLCELGKAINLLAPWFDHTMAETLIVNKACDGRQEKVELIAQKLKDGIGEACPTSVSWNPLDKASKVYEYPSEKCKSKVNVEKLRDAERQLDLFWKRLDKAVQSAQNISLEKVLKRRMLDKTPRRLYRTAPWKEEAPVSPPREKSAPIGVLSETDGNVPRSGKAFLLDLTDKVKTRGVAAGAHHHPATGRAGDAPPPEPEVVVSKVKLGKKAYKIWLTLLPSVESAQYPRPELAWDELLSGMRAIGLEPEKLYGSVWQFSPRNTKILINRSIQFHEPKEVRKGGKIPKPMVRTFGRRLRHAFGWESAEAMFELE